MREKRDEVRDEREGVRKERCKMRERDKRGEMGGKR